jgi:hypothetical protein
LSLDIEITRAQTRNYALADGFDRMARQTNNTWSLFLRYQAQAERHYRRAVEEFDRLKALRADLPNEPILDIQPEDNETACAPPEEPISTPQPNPEPLSGAAPCAAQSAVARRADGAPCVHEAEAPQAAGAHSQDPSVKQAWLARKPVMEGWQCANASEALRANLPFKARTSVPRD